MRMSKKPKKEVGKVVKKKKSRGLAPKLRRLDIIILVIIVAMIASGLYITFFGLPAMPAASAKTPVNPLDALRKDVESVFAKNLTNTSLIVRYRVRGDYVLNTSLSVSDTLLIMAFYSRNMSTWFAYYTAAPHVNAVLGRLGIELIQESNLTLPPKLSKPEELLINMLRLQQRNASITEDYVGDETVSLTLSAINVSTSALQKINTITVDRVTEVLKYTVSEGDSNLTVMLWIDKELRVPLKAKMISEGHELAFTLTDVGVL